MAKTYKVTYAAPDIDKDTTVNLDLATTYKKKEAGNKKIVFNLKALKQEQPTPTPTTNYVVAKNDSRFGAKAKQHTDGNYYCFIVILQELTIPSGKTGNMTASFKNDLFSGSTMQNKLEFTGGKTYKINDEVISKGVSYSGEFNVTECNIDSFTIS